MSRRGRRRTNEEWQETIKDKPYTTSEYIKTEQHVIAICKVCEHKWSVTPASLLRGSGCPNCSNIRLRRKDYPFMHEIREDYQKKIKKGLINGGKKVPFICKEHGEYWQQLFSHFNHGCPYCAGTKNTMEFDFMHEITPYWQEKIKNGELLMKDKVEFICDKHGIYWQTLQKHSSGQSCPLCAPNLRKLEYDYMDEICPKDQEKIRNGLVPHDGIVTFICPKHGRYKKQVKHHKVDGNCQKCSQENRIRNNYPFMEEIREDYQIKIRNREVLGKDKVPFICEHHREYWQSLNNHQSGFGCHFCAITKTPYHFMEFLRSVYKDNIITNDRTQIWPLEIDFYFPDIKIGFEFNDIATHGTNMKDKDYHLNKHLLTKERGIRLFHIWDFEWGNDDYREVIQERIVNSITKQPKPRNEEIIHLNNDYESCLHLLNDYEILEITKEKKTYEGYAYYTSGITTLRRKNDGG